VRDRAGIGEAGECVVSGVGRRRAVSRLLHGEKDPLVPLDESERLFASLQKAGVPVSFGALPGAGHGGWQFDTPELRQRILRFLRQHFGE